MVKKKKIALHFLQSKPSYDFYSSAKHHHHYFCSSRHRFYQTKVFLLWSLALSLIGSLSCLKVLCWRELNLKVGHWGLASRLIYRKPSAYLVQILVYSIGRCCLYHKGSKFAPNLHDLSQIF